METFYLLFTSLVLIALYLLTRDIRTHSATADLPRVDQGPLYKRLFIEPGVGQIAEFFREVPNDGLIVYQGIFGLERILCTNPRALHEIEVAQANSFVMHPVARKELKTWLGDGLVTAEGEKHRQQRKILQQVFKHRWIRDSYPVFWRKTVELIQVLQEHSKKQEPVDILDPICRATLDVIGACGFGLDIGSLAEPDNLFFARYRKLFMPSGKGHVFHLLAFLLPECILNVLPLQANEEMHRAGEAVKTLIKEPIVEREVAMHLEKSDSKEVGKMDIISTLLREGSMAEPDMLVDQSMTFLGAGHDTVSQTINRAIYELCLRPGLQMRVRQEVRQALPYPLGQGSCPDMELLERVDSLPLLAAVLNETLRLHPAVPVLRRYATDVVRLNGREFPKGSFCVMPVQEINRASAFWGGDAAEFRPERWLEDVGGGANEKGAFQTFGAGPRNCIGEKFARAEMAFMVALLVGCFELEFAGAGTDGKAKEPIVENTHVVRMVGGLWVKFKELEMW